MLGLKNKIIHGHEGPTEAIEVEPPVLDQTSAGFFNREQMAGMLSAQSLMGPEHTDDTIGIDSDRGSVLELLREILDALQNLKPVTKLAVVGDRTVATSGAGSSFNFEIGGRRVLAYSILVQNNTAAPLYLGLDAPATTGGIVIAVGTIFRITDVALRQIYLLSTVAANITGVDSGNVQAVAGVVVYAWGN